MLKRLFSIRNPKSEIRNRKSSTVFHSTLCILHSAFLSLGLSFYSCSEPSDSPIIVASTGTEVGAAVGADTTWRAAESPYLVVADLIVPESVTLTVEAGTEALFDAGTALIVHGRLMAVGTSAQLVVFTKSPNAVGWKGIICKNRDGVQSRLQYAKIAYAETGIACEGASPELVDCQITDNQTGILLDGSAARITHNLVQGNETGIAIANASYLAKPPTVSNNVITENALGVVVAAAVQLPIALSHNNIDGNYEYGLFIQGVCKVGSLGHQKDCDAVDATGNWWGDTGETAIAAQIFDRDDQPNTRRVVYVPYAVGSIPQAGPRNAD